MPCSTSARVLAWLLLAPLARLHAQTPAAPPFVVDTWSTDEGLPQNTVSAIVQARRGYLWVGTNGGLVRFDGVRFTVFNRTTTPALPNDRVLALVEDRHQALWVGTQGGGVMRLGPDGQTRTFAKAEGLPSASVLSLLETRAGALWAGTEEGLARFEGGRFVRHPAIPAMFVRCLYEAPDGTLWVGTSERVFHLGRTGVASYIVPNLANRKPIVGIAGAADGTLWVATDGAGLFRFDGTGFQSVPGPTGMGLYSRALVADADGTLWAASGAGVYRYRDGRMASALTTASGLSTDLTRTVYPDAAGQVWIGTDNGGLNRLAEAPFRLIGAAQGLATDVVFSITEDRAGDQWLGTNCGGLARVHQGAVRTFAEADGLVNACITAVLEDRAGRLWVGSYGGGLFYRDGTRFRPYDAPLPGRSVLVLYEDRAGALWIGTYDGGLSRLKDGRLTTYTTAQGLPGNWVRGVREDQAGTLWVATNGGVGRLRDGRFTTLTMAEGLSSNDARALYEDSTGAMWVGTYGAGLNLVRGNEVVRITMAHGLPENVVSAILEDAYGFLWMTGNRGITRVARAELDAFAAGRRRTFNARLFGREAGLKQAETNGGFQPAAWKGADGRLWFPTFSGAAVVDPARLGPRQPPPPVIIEQVRAAGEQWPGQARVRLPLGVRQFDVAYTGLALGTARQTRFRYRLAGQDTAWVEAGTRRVAYFTNVAPGHYTFEVAAASPSGAWTPEPATLALDVPPYLGEQGWFRLLLALVFVGLVAGGVRVRLRRLGARSAALERAVEARTTELRDEKTHAEGARRLAEEQRGIAEAIRGTVEVQAAELKTLDAAKSRFFANLSHEFRTPLTLIIGPVESVAHDLRVAGQDGVADELATALQSARRLQRLIDQLLDLARLESRALPFQPHLADLGAFTREIVFAFAGLAEQRGVTLTFQAPEAPVRCPFDSDAVEKVAFNLVANALKFTAPGGRIAVRVTTDVQGGAPVALLSVRDTGTGIAADKLPFLFDRFFQADPHHARTGSGIGLALAHELVTLHGGHLAVESKEGFGSTFTASFPLPATVPAATGPEEVVAQPSGAETAPVAPQAPASSASEAGATARPVVLLVEDNDEVRTFTRRHLRDRYTVLEAKDGRAGLQAAFDHRPHLVVTDVMMPEMDGLELCARLKADPRTALTPVLMLTARASPESRVSGLETGADDYLAKPFVARELQARVENLLRSRTQLQQTYGQTITLAPTGVHLASADAQFVEAVRRAVEARIADPDFDVQMLAGAVGVSYSSLHRRLKTLTGQPPVQFMRTMRLLRAADLLTQRTGTVAEVAFASGFNNVSYFARCFREQFGVAPSAYVAAKGAEGASPPE